MELTKIKDIKNGAIRLVSKEIASDFIGTGDFEIVKEEIKSNNNESIDKEIKKSNVNCKK